MNDELSQHDLEQPILEWQRLGGRALHADAGVTIPNRLDKRL
jgi:hypothetical protein